MDKKEIKRKFKKYQWVILLAVTILFSMWIYGMTTHYFPEPISLGGGQYIDIATGVVIIGLLLSGVVLAFIFKKNRGEIGTGEFVKIKVSKKKESKKR